ncbi:exonuclease domain-containing protein [Williamsia sp. 1135]|uniref:exonuclease domain-containing protein n=1 Tax=Williamsia sp. 1135 TaxID=1889262 RepID=UPI001438A9EC|nr:exonuclease domain-containing protein [Williamsia sp. 1135]
MLNYTAIDFETANSYRGSPCSVGLVRVRNGVPDETRHWMMQPPDRVDDFAPFNVSLHGITRAQVAEQPRWRDVLPDIVDFIGDDVVVAHNAGFDIGVVRYACAADDIDWPDVSFLCTMVLARRALSLPAYRLPYVVAALDGGVIDHHDALADALGVVHVVRELAAMHNAQDIFELAESVGVSIGRMATGSYAGSASLLNQQHTRLVQPGLNPEADTGGYLYGRVVVFTGALLSMTRRIAWEECARVGASAEENTTKRTNVLVVGDINPAVLRPGSTVTGKTKRAFELQEGGQPIEVMTEDDFLKCLDGKPLDEPTVLLKGENHHELAAPKPLPKHQRMVPLAQRRDPNPPQDPKPPRQLRRKRVPTEQVCSVRNCSRTAAFKTRTKPTWCEEHIAAQQRIARLKPLDSFTHPDDWQLTECLSCTVQAHYRFAYTIEKISYGEPTCRACYWRQWAVQSRELLGAWARTEPTTYSDALNIADENGYEYLGPLTAPSLTDDPHRVRCRRCQRISATRLSDIAFGCSTCKPSTR